MSRKKRNKRPEPAAAPSVAAATSASQAAVAPRTSAAAPPPVPRSAARAHPGSPSPAETTGAHPSSSRAQDPARSGRSVVVRGVPVAGAETDADGDAAVELEADDAGADDGAHVAGVADAGDDDDTAAVLRELVALRRGAGAGRYSDRRVVGIGGVGVVTSEFDHVLRRRFAAKTLHDEARARSTLVRLFLREAQITAALEHPNIVPVHDLVVDDDGRIYFTMKLVQGRTLLQLIDEAAGDREARLRGALDAIFRVCDALSYAHSRGVVHCDIKPDNVMVGAFGQVYLMDWGFAHVGGAAGRTQIHALPITALTGTAFGTPAYMAPEQALALHDEIDARTDVFGLGALLYHALTGHAPYRSDQLLHTMLLAQQGVFERLDAPAAPSADCPAELARIVHRAMAPAREDRYASVEELRADLERFVRGGASFPTMRVAAGEHVLREGDAGDAAYIVTAGALEVYKTIDGRRVVLGALGPGDTFGEMALLAPAPRTASVVATADALLVRVTRDAVDLEMRTMKPWMGMFVRTLTQRFRDVQEAAMKGKLDRGKKAWWRLW